MKLDLVDPRGWRPTAEMLSFDMQNSKEVCTSTTQVWICIVCGNGGRWRKMVEYGGRASQNQQLRFSRRPYFICTVFESIQPLCAQYLRNNSGVDSLVRRAQRAAGGLKAWDSQLTEFQSLSPLCAVRYAHR